MRGGARPRPRRRVTTWIHGRSAAALRLTVGVGLLALGLVTLPTPIPIGLVLIAAGCALVLAQSRLAQRALYRSRERWPGWSQRLRRGQRYLPAAWQRVLACTDPDRAPEP